MLRPIGAADIAQGVKALADDLTAYATRVIYREMRPEFRKIAEDAAAGDFGEARLKASALKFTGAVGGITKRVRKFTRSVTILGAGAVDRPSTSVFANGEPFPEVIDEGAVSLISNTIILLAERDVIRRLLRGLDVVQRAQQDRIEEERAENIEKALWPPSSGSDNPFSPDALATNINKFLRGEIKRVVEVSSNLVGTRVAAYGMLHEATARGIQRYRLDATLDERTTDICRHLNGKEFTVSMAFDRLKKIMTITSPDQIKKAAPFPELENIEKLSDDDLQALGFDTPPFHFLCRTVVTLIESSIEEGPPPIPEFPTEGRVLPGQDMYDWFRDNARTEFNETFGRGSYEKLLDGDRPSDSVQARIKPFVEYSGPLYRDTNTLLRQNSEYARRDEVVEAIAAMDKTFERSKKGLRKGQFLYRGVDRNVGSRMEIGYTFQDDAYVSVSAKMDIAENFAGDSGTVVQIYVPPGTKVAPLMPFSQYQNEAEFLLSRASQFRVIGEHTVTSRVGPRRVLKAVYVGEGKKLKAGDLGKQPLPAAEGIRKEVDLSRRDHYVWGEGDFRIVSFDG